MYLLGAPLFVLHKQTCRCASSDGKLSGAGEPGAFNRGVQNHIRRARVFTSVAGHLAFGLVGARDMSE